MNLTGGIDMYNWEGRYLSGKAPYGRKVVYLGTGGWDKDVEFANQYFTVGQVLTVDEIYVGRSSSRVSFIETEGKQFNTVMFQDVE